MKHEHVAGLVRHRIEQAQQALEDARFLFEGNRTTQSVINRLYYAMFYAVLALLQTVGKSPSKHRGVMSFCDTEFVMKDIFPKSMSKNLHDAFDLRQTSDYDPIESVPREVANEMVKKAEVFVKTIQDYLRRKAYF